MRKSRAWRRLLRCEKSFPHSPEQGTPVGENSYYFLLEYFIDGVPASAGMRGVTGRDEEKKSKNLCS